MEYVYRPSGVCSREFRFDIENNIIKNVKIIGGCNGNLQGISVLIKDMNIDEVIDKLLGIRCGFKNTSCPDQIANALIKYKEESNN